MAQWTKLAVVLVVTTAVLATPLVNDLAPGKEWPQRASVKQPSETFEIAEVIAENESEQKNSELLPQAQPAEANAEAPETNEGQAGDEEINDEAKENQLKSAKDAKTEETKVDYTGAQVWSISTNKTGVRPVLTRLRRRNLLATWGGNQTHVDVLVKSQAIKNVTRIFKRENIHYEVLIEDIQKRINEENPPLDENELQLQDRRARAYNFWRYRGSHRRKGLIGAYMGYNSLDIPKEYWPSANWGHRMTWQQYHRVDDINGFMEYLEKTYPATVSVKSIGKSYEGRDIKLIRISDGKPTNKAVFIDGGIHAREWISPATVTFFINQIAENFDEESDDFKNIDWYIVPVLNPDGYEYTHVMDRFWRKNRKPVLSGTSTCVGTDLNRNFGYKWGGKGASVYPCSEAYRGSRAFSEPESKALADFITNSGVKFAAYLTYHSYGQYLLYPWGYDNVVPPDYKDLDQVGKEVAEAIQTTGGDVYRVGSSSGLLYPASGGSDDWAKAQGIKYSYTIELSDTGKYGFALPASYILPVAKESLAGLRVVAKKVHSG